MKKFLTLCIALLLSASVHAQTQNRTSGGLFPELNGVKGATSQQRSEHQDAGMIRLIIDDVSIVNPPLNGISFCVGKMRVENQMNVNIRTLEIFAQYGNLSVPVAFRNVPANGGTQEQSLAFAGENCNSLLNVPRITVRTCVAGNLNDQGCQQRIKYVPIS